jgi:hypothetical protein
MKQQDKTLKGTLQFRMYRHPQSSMNFADMRPRFVIAWLLHFAISITVLAFGSMNNHGER